jgi:hypothetical protein
MGRGTEVTPVVLKVVAVCQYCVGHGFVSRLTVFLVDASASVFLLRLFDKMRGMKICEDASRGLHKIIPFSLFLFK